MSSRQSTVASSYSRRNFQEDVLVRRRNAEWDRQQLWNGVTKYFQTWDVKSNKHNDWTSSEYYNQSMELYKKACEAQKKAQHLVERREKLSNLLFCEDQKYQIELMQRKRHSVSNHQRMPLEELKIFNYELKRRDEEKQRREAELKLYHHWKMQEPSIRELESKQHGHFVREAWVKQVQQKKEEQEKAEKEKLEAMRERELMQRAEDERQKLEHEQRKEKALALQDQLRQQVEELREKERQAEILKVAESQAIQKRVELENITMERRRVEERRKKVELRSFLQCQYQLKLRQRSKEIQVQLAEDLCLLRKLMSLEAEEKARESETREAAYREMIYAQETLAKQTQIEKEREKRMEFLFHEEAQQMWAQQEEKWKLEHEARERLMSDVLVTLQTQLDEKLKGNLAEQRQLVTTREEIVSLVEKANAELKEERAAINRMKESLKKNLDFQVADKQERLKTEARIAELEAKKKKEEAKLEEQKLLDELRKMEVTGYKPKSVARRRMLW